MSYSNIGTLLQKSKNTLPPDAWLVLTKKELKDNKLNWRKLVKQQALSNLYDEDVLNQERFVKFTIGLLRSPFLSLRQQEELRDIWHDKNTTVDQKANAIIKLAARAGYYDVGCVKLMPSFLKLFSNDQELFNFLRAPQQFINQNNQLTPYQKQLLDFIVNDPVTKYFKIGEHINETYESELTTAMKMLNLQRYGCRDAPNFLPCIHPNVVDQVLEKSNRSYMGGKTFIGLSGASDHYTRKMISNTANVVTETKMGECHTFAQLAAEHLLKVAEEQKLPIDIKIVSHKDGRGSHTFLLVNHYNEDLNDLSNCLIVDPWAYVMGYTDTQGIFTLDNYPYPNMTTNLLCCYNSTEDVEHLNRRYNIIINSEEYQSYMSNIPIEKEESVDAIQAKQFIEYLYGGVQNLIPDQTKEELIKEILKDLSFEEISPAKAMKLATDVFFAGHVDGNTHEGFSWTKHDNITDNDLGQSEDYKNYFVEAFNRYPAVKSFWTNYLQQSHPGENLNTTKITVESIVKIGQDLANSETLKHEYSPRNPDAVFTISY
ncbi:hypothetical protein [Legionella cardiaca]|uniref:Uncharacterized protein n=1 Tax=Legionella cardiaca TaxID=1071983 RepID=A0ABY8APN4_9GAMM|nr:hypothetical protein [Legionella cardiaca]WED42678.1 hypothetical protein PXX05_12340 [Legionella cardiaca]